MTSGFIVYIPVFSKTLARKRFSATGQNPGIGGTQFTAVKLATLLAESYPQLDIRLVNDTELLIDSCPDNLSTEVVADINQFFDFRESDTAPFVVICTMSLLKQVSVDTLRGSRQKIIAWIHHPFQLDERISKMGFVAHVCVGSYQYYSNRSFYKSVWHIQNPFTAVSTESVVNRTPRTEVPSKRIRIVFLGALIRAKGFIHIARQWDAIKHALTDVELHVIGSSGTYGREPENGLIPCDNQLAQEILEYIPKDDIESGKVIFHGNLGDEKFDVLRQCDVAALNPTGQTEAFPASPLECMGGGLPVIASDDYGMADSMAFFPELTLTRPEQIPDRLRWLFADQLRYEELSQRAFAIADWFDSQTGVILARWRRLLQFVADRELPISDNPPTVPLYGRRVRLLKRVILTRLSQVKRRIKELVRKAS